MSEERAKQTGVYFVGRERIRFAMNQALALVTTNDRLNEDQGRVGGYMYLLHDDPMTSRSNRIPILVELIGREYPYMIASEQAGYYFATCEEKAARLVQWPDHISSWQSRAIGLQRFGGAIRLQTHILSFSGLSEHGDEAVCVLAAKIAGLLTDAGAQAIIKISDNGRLRKLLQKPEAIKCIEDAQRRFAREDRMRTSKV